MWGQAAADFSIDSAGAVSLMNRDLRFAATSILIISMIANSAETIVQ
jgi:hypothetical protein